MTSPVIWLFVSYETDTGLAYAKLAKARFRVAGLNAWVWHEDRTIGEYTHEEIADKINEYNHFVYICTDGSHESEGQKFERGVALALKVDPLVIALAGARVSPVLANRNRTPTRPAHFEDACAEVATEIHRREQALVGDATVKQEGQPLEPA